MPSVAFLTTEPEGDDGGGSMFVAMFYQCSLWKALMLYKFVTDYCHSPTEIALMGCSLEKVGLYALGIQSVHKVKSKY